MIHTGLNPPTAPTSESGRCLAYMSNADCTLTHIIWCAMRIHVASLTDEVIVRLPVTDPENWTAK